MSIFKKEKCRRESSVVPEEEERKKQRNGALDVFSYKTGAAAAATEQVAWSWRERFHGLCLARLNLSAPKPMDLPPAHHILPDQATCGPLLGLAIFQNLHNAEYIRSVHVYNRNDSPLTIQQEFLLKPGAFSRISSPILLACTALTDLKAYLEMVRRTHESEWWKCILHFCSSCPGDAIMTVPFLRDPDLQAIPSLAEDLRLIELYLSSMSGTVVGETVYNGQSPNCSPPAPYPYLREEGYTDNVNQVRATESCKNQMPKKLQLHLWQKWGSDLELASPRVSDMFDLPSLKSNNNEASMQLSGAVSSPAPSSFSSQNAQSSSWGSITFRESSNSMGQMVSEHSFLDVSLGAPAKISADVPQAPPCDYFVAESPFTSFKLGNVQTPEDKESLAGCWKNRATSGSVWERASVSKNFSFLEEDPAEESDLEWGETGGCKREGNSSATSHRPNHSRAATGRSTELSFDEVSQYFYMPINKASKELKVGLTVLKKRCRVFGIRRWPHRKMKSLVSLQHNLEYSGKKDGAKNTDRIQKTVEELKKQRKEMEEKPWIELADRTKRLRQAWFKVIYRERRQQKHPFDTPSISSTPDIEAIPVPPTDNQTSVQSYLQDSSCMETLASVTPIMSFLHNDASNGSSNNSLKFNKNKGSSSMACSSFLVWSS